MNSDKLLIPLSELPPGENGRIMSILSSQIQRILSELGISNQSEISCLFQAPAKGPRAYQCGEMQFALRYTDSQHILIELLS
jgi:Fe2+ transport system protein FeoA